jgi:hypothetical protein
MVKPQRRLTFPKSAHHDNDRAGQLLKSRSNLKERHEAASLVDRSGNIKVYSRLLEQIRPAP